MMGQLKSTFAVFDQDDIQDIEGKPVSPGEFSEIALLHPLKLTDLQLREWKKILDSHKLKQAFLQIERPVQRLSDGEVHDIEVLRLARLKIPAAVIVGTLERHGWQRGPVMDGGLFTEHVKYFPSGDVTAIIQYQGIPTGTGGVDWEDQYIDHCLFLPGRVAGDYGRDFEKGIKLGEIDPVILSEVLCNLELLKAKGTSA